MKSKKMKLTKGGAASGFGNEFVASNMRWRLPNDFQSTVGGFRIVCNAKVK